MKEDENLNNFRYNIALTNICYNIKGRLNLSENSKIYIDWTKELFQNVTKSLDSIVSLKEDEGYFITPHLTDIINIYLGDNNSRSFLLSDVEKLRESFQLMSNKLDNMKTNPHKFYKTKDSEEIFNFLDKLSASFLKFSCN
jgi:hypothetical protein